MYYSTFSKWVDLGGSIDLGGSAGREGGEREGRRGEEDSPSGIDGRG